VLGTLLGNYRVVERLGEGGMGVVYIGRHETLGHRVVIKVLLPRLSSNREMLQRFFNEAQAATAIRNPGIAQVFDFGVAADNCAYIAMELLDGESLAARLKRRRIDHRECCRIGRQVANVLHAAHEAGIVHRDLKPDNLFLVPDPEVIGGERVKVLDFGIAKLAGEARAASMKTISNLAMGTPNYMSPEQCRSASAADPRSDVYSLGCILFEIACRRPPFVFASICEIVAAHVHEPPPHPQSIDPDMLSGLSTLIYQMLSKQPDARPQTMAVVSQSLADILQTLDGGPTLVSAKPQAVVFAAAPASSSTPAPDAATKLRPLSPGATTRRRLTGVTPVRRLVGRWLFLFGSSVFAGAAAGAIIFALAVGQSDSGTLVSYSSIPASRRAVDSHRAEMLPPASQSVAEVVEPSEAIPAAGPRVLAEAPRDVRGAPPPTCDADALTDQGRRQFTDGQLVESLASYEAAYACQPVSALLQTQLVVICNLHDEAKARSLWERLHHTRTTPAMLEICNRDGTGAALAAP
jgi:serine/threonine protein kinase